MEVYRLILFTLRPGMGYPEGGSYDTGATYQGGSLDNPGACHPAQFNYLKDAVQHATNNGEIPVIVKNEADVWAILAGQKAITDDMIVKPGEENKTLAASGGFLGGLDMTTVALVGVGALVILPMVFGRKRGAQ